jgi:hypothetical protein
MPAYTAGKLIWNAGRRLAVAHLQFGAMAQQDAVDDGQA